MPLWLHRTDKVLLPSVASADLPEAQANYIEEPDLSAVSGFASKYWLITGDIVSLIDVAARAVVDAAEVSALRDSFSEEIDEAETYTRAFALVVLDEFNTVALKINEILDAIDSANNLSQVKSNIAAITDRPQRTAAQLKTAVRNRADT